MSELVGKVLEGKYRLTSKLGSGGVGTVYEATHVVIGQKFAIKILKPEFAGNPTQALRLVQEAKSASAIDHPSIIRVFDAGRTKDGLTFLVMELLHGEELAAHIKARAPFDVDEAVDITCDVLEALVAAHQRNIIHRDLKPENVFLTRGPRGQRWTKLLDFGIAKVVDQKLAFPRLTHEGTVVGTPFYMSPEHARGARDLDGRVDVYATGVILFEMLTRRVPYDGSSYNEVLSKVLSDPFPRPSSYNPVVSEGLEAVILRATAGDRDARFPTAQAFLEALEPFRPEITSTVTKLDVIERMARDRGVNSGDVELLPEESVPTLVGEARGPSRTPPSSRARSSPGEDAADDSTPAAAPASASPSVVAAAETLRLAGDAPRPKEGGLREAGTLAGSLVPVERLSRRRLTALAVVGFVTLVAVAAVFWLLWQRGGGTTSRSGAAGAEATAPADAGGTTTPPAEAVDAGATPAPAVAAAEPDAAEPDGGAPTAAAVDPGADAGTDLGTYVALYDVPTPDGEPPPDDGKVTVHIVGAPASAKLFVDGDPVSTPFRLEPSPGQHRLRILAPGFRPYNTVFKATEDFAISVRMYRDRGSTPPPDAGTARDARSGQLQPNPFLTPSR